MRLGLLCSSRCPSNIIVYSLDAAAALRGASVIVASGVQSPVERECLKLLLPGTLPLVICPARSATGMRIPAAWRSAIAANRLTIRSAVDEGFEAQHHAAQPGKAPRRPTTGLAEQRNRFVAAISDTVLILHASPGGKLDRLATDLLAEGRKPVWTLEDPANAQLIARGARAVRPSDVAAIWEEM